MSEPTLKLWTNGPEWVIAYDPLDAAKAWGEHIGEDHVDHGHTWREETAKRFRQTGEETDTRLTMATAEWCTRNGRGYLCATGH